MRALLQRTTGARVRVGGVRGGRGRAAGSSSCSASDRPTTRRSRTSLARRVTELRIFDDEDGPDEPVADRRRRRGARRVSQFTLYADTRRGRRPGFTGAAAPELAERLYLRFAAALRELGVEVATGRFGEVMAVELVNDGPFTIWLDTATADGRRRPSA